MRNNRKMTVLLIAAVGTVLGVGGFALAAFIQDSTVDFVPGSAEAFVPADQHDRASPRTETAAATQD